MDKNISYDGIFKELFDELPDENVMEFINTLFGKNYPNDSEVIRLATESHIDGKERRSDIMIRVGGDMYHIEVQTNDHKEIALRVFEYSYRASLQHGKTVRSDYLELDFPKSVVFYLRSDEKTPHELTVKLNLPDGSTAEFKIHAKHLKEYTPQDLTDKSMFAFAPHFPLTFGDKIDSGALEKLREGNRKIVDTLANKAANGEISSRIVDLVISGLKTITEDVLMKNGTTQKEVDEFMEAIERRYNIPLLDAEARGRVEGIIEIAKRMLNRGRPIEEIMEDTGLKIETLEELQSEIQDT